MDSIVLCTLRFECHSFVLFNQSSGFTLLLLISKRTGTTFEQKSAALVTKVTAFETIQKRKSTSSVIQHTRTIVFLCKSLSRIKAS